jgi:hypothetical protein
MKQVMTGIRLPCPNRRADPSHAPQRERLGGRVRFGQAVT